MSISVLIPCFNAGEKVWRAIASANAQNGVDEVIVIDDASWDDSKALLAIAADKFPKVKVAAHLKNKGAQKTRNNLILASTPGRDRWLCFLDADDEIISHENSLLLRTKTEADIDITYCDMSIERYESGNRLRDREYWPTNRRSLLEALAAFEFVPSTSALMFRRECFTKVCWDEGEAYKGGMHCFQILLAALKAGLSLDHVSVEGILYREGWSEDQISGKKNRLPRLFARKHWQQQLFEWLREQGDYEEAIALGQKKFDFEWEQEVSLAQSNPTAINAVMP